MAEPRYSNAFHRLYGIVLKLSLKSANFRKSSTGHLAKGAKAISQPVPSLVSGLEQHHIPTINGFRAIAVLLVIFYHSGLTWIPGGLGVLMFFAISGFVITWMLLKENTRTGSISLKRFYARRSLRIFPAFYTYVLVTLVILGILHKRVNWVQLAASLVYSANYYQAIYGDPSTVFSHTWSLGIEEQFYLCWPPLFSVLRQRVTLLIQGIAVVIAAVWVHRFLLKFIFHVWQGYLYEAFDTRLDHVLIGCLLALLLYYFPEHRLWRVICSRPAVTGLTVVLLVLSAAAEARWGDIYRDTWGFIVNPILCAFLIPQVISLRERPLVRLFDSPFVSYMGTISYSLYLYQQLLLEPVQKALHRTPYPVQLAMAMVVLIAAASISYQFVEKPFLRMQSRFRN